jgi:glycosyltransferase involved in cell wall biosynthesis
MSVAISPARALSHSLPGATVLQILPALVNEPTARAAVNVASALLRSGARAIVASAGGRFVGELQALGGEWLQMPTNTHNPLTLRSNARKFSELIASERIDVVHAYSGETAWSARAAIRRSGAWLVTTYAGTPVAPFQPGWYRQGALARGHRVIVESGYAADLVVKRHGIPAERVVAIPRSIDTVRFEPAAVSAERIAVLRHGWRIGAGTGVILVPGHLAEGKGQMTVVDAARILVNGGLRGIVFIIAGDADQDPEYAVELGRRIRAQGLGGIVRRIGHCPDMPAAYALADMVIIPAIEPRTFNLAAAEAHAMARPIIASAVGALPEIVPAPPHVSEQDRLGWLVPPADPVELARAVATLIGLSSAVRQALRTRARRFAETLFAPMRVAGATLGVYSSLLEG